MKLAIACEHAGFSLKQEIIHHLEASHSIKDLGIYSDEPTDYPKIAMELADEVVSGKYELGILICGTGIGMSIAAGKVRGARAALCTNEYMAKMTRRHNDANILCLGAWVTGSRLSFDIVDRFIIEEFEGGRHERRINAIAELSMKYYK